MNLHDKHVAVIMGGKSPERDVSLDTGKACARAINNLNIKTTTIDVDEHFIDTIKNTKPDIVFNALHGKWGEDGNVQAILEFLKIPYTHSGVCASATAMNKDIAKAVYKHNQIPVAHHITITFQELKAQCARNTQHPIPPPYVIKPVEGGSSVGVRIVSQNETLPDFSDSNNQKTYHDHDLLMIEEFIPGRELTCAVMGDKPLAVIDIKPAQNMTFYNYQAKYAKGGSQHILPAQIPTDIYQKIQQYARTAHKKLGCKGISRSDFRWDEKTNPIILETNTQPGMTETSLVPEIAQYEGISFEKLVTWMLEDASCER